MMKTLIGLSVSLWLFSPSSIGATAATQLDASGSLSRGLGALNREPLPPKYSYSFQSPTLRNGVYEQVRVDSTVPFPDYSSWEPAGLGHSINPQSPVVGSWGDAYRRGRAAVFEVVIRFHIHYFHAIAYYPDVSGPPRHYIKHGEGAGFKEFEIDPSWTVEKVFPDFER